MRLFSTCALLQAIGVAAYSKSLLLDYTWPNHQKCVEIGSVSPFRPDSASSLTLAFNPGQGIVSAVVFELGDEHLGGMRRPGSNEKEVFCTKQNIQNELCTESQLGQFLISEKATRRAAYPFITRAVNLSSPISIQYPVEKPGFYCAALYGFSASSFSATLQAIEPKTTLPAFRVGLQAVYRYLGPVWITFSLLWTFLRTSEPRSALCWLLPLSTVQVAVRWLGLGLGERAPAILTISWYVVEAVQNSVVLVHSHDSLSSQRPRRSWFVWVFLVLYLVLSAAMAVADYTATVESRIPAYGNIVLGILLAIYIAVNVFWLWREHHPGAGMKSWAVSRDENTVRSAIVLGTVGVLSFGAAILNAWYVNHHRKPLEFGHAFWQIRYLTIDGPFEFIFLFWTLSLALYCGGSHARSVATTIEMGDQVEPLTSDVDK
ncbi:hypothetical protein BO78DRAFT_445774 [Aspergillus sclerotiicarbonarius CBS 121057]|uniref:PTM1-like N-terminal domain-containing protein n=1 Tax=Aspergillus sclerotiicarbonarius (strain CBS 121057 / IBT 28362) TaxID=1448318 RepID=A0A319EQT9_ASPSB|nr:hypothetical protein BO78DRAFT_445774 [Aspergillus sclerotiicarbonarius CBS 121057]